MRISWYCLGMSESQSYINIQHTWFQISNLVFIFLQKFKIIPKREGWFLLFLRGSTYDNMKPDRLCIKTPAFVLFFFFFFFFLFFFFWFWFSLRTSTQNKHRSRCNVQGRQIMYQVTNIRYEYVARLIVRQCLSSCFWMKTLEHPLNDGHVKHALPHKKQWIYELHLLKATTTNFGERFILFFFSNVYIFFLL